MDGTAYEVGARIELEAATLDVEALAGVEPTVALPLIALPLVPPQPPSATARYAHPMALICAAALHLAVLALLLPATSDAIGDGGEAPEAVAVAVVDRIPQVSLPTAGAPDQPVEAIQAEEPQPEAPQPPPAEAKLPDPVRPELTLPPEPDLAPQLDAPTLPVKLPEPDKQPDKPPHKVPDQTVEPPREKPDSQAAAAAPAQVAAAMAAVAAVEASPGVVKAYESALTKVIAARPPRNRGIRGRVVVQLVIGQDGTAETASIIETSGRRQLDELVIAALQKLRFPAPPADMTLRQRTFHQAFVYN